MSVIWIDLWDKRVWVAICVEGIPMPKDIVPRVRIIDYLKTIFKSDNNIETIVVWLPYDLYDSDNKQLEKTQKFIKKLENIFPLKKIIWVDERYTSFEADSVLDNMWEKDKEWKKDAIAASLILETYLKTINK